MRVPGGPKQEAGPPQFFHRGSSIFIGEGDIVISHPHDRSKQQFLLYLQQHTERGGRAYVRLARGINPFILAVIL